MIKTKKIVLVLLILSAISGQMQAQGIDILSQKNSLNLSLDLGILILNSNSALDANGKERISDKAKEGDTPNTVWVFPLFDIRYTLRDTQTQLFWGTPIDGSNIALSFGLIQPVKDVGIITASVAPSFGVNVWKNPYLENVERKKTNLNIMTTHFKLERVAFTPFNVAYSYRTIDVADDEIGRWNSDLRRDGKIEGFSAKYDIGITQSSLLSPGIALEKGIFDGDSNSYGQTGLTLSYKAFSRAHLFMFEASASQADFAKEHPIYNETRHDQSVNCFVLYRIQGLFEIGSLHSNIAFGAGIINSNIDFFDSNVLYIAFTVGYAF